MKREKREIGTPLNVHITTREYCTTKSHRGGVFQQWQQEKTTCEQQLVLTEKGEKVHEAAQRFGSEGGVNKKNVAIGHDWKVRAPKVGRVCCKEKHCVSKRRGPEG